MSRTAADFNRVNYARQSALFGIHNIDESVERAMNPMQTELIKRPPIDYSAYEQRTLHDGQTKFFENESLLFNQVISSITGHGSSAGDLQSMLADSYP